MGDFRTTETMLGNSDYDYSTLTASVYDLVQKVPARTLLEASTSHDLFQSVVQARGFGNFRANHITLWLAASSGKKVCIPAGGEEDILEPNPRLFRSWCGNYFAYAELLQECAKQFQVHPDLGFEETTAEGLVIKVSFNVQIDAVFLQFAICKVAQGLRLCSELRMQGLCWRSGSLEVAAEDTD